MLEQISTWLAGNGVWLAVSTVAFFTLKGVAWLVLPAMIWRFSAKHKAAAALNRAVDP